MGVYKVGMEGTFGYSEQDLIDIRKRNPSFNHIGPVEGTLVMEPELHDGGLVFACSNGGNYGWFKPKYSIKPKLELFSIIVTSGKFFLTSFTLPSEESLST